MPLTRRALLGAAALGLAGCAGSPVVTGTPAAAPSPTVLTQNPDAASAAAAVAHLGAVIAALSGSPAWAEKPWAEAALVQSTAHLERLTLANPLIEGGERFEQEPEPVPAPSTPDAAEALVAAAIDDATQHLDAAATAAEEPALRLAYASARAATAALRVRTSAPVPGTAVPHPLQATTLEASLPIALGHVWSLIYALGVGLGRLPAKDPLHAIGSTRLAQAKHLRNSLRDRLDAAPEQPAAFDLPNPMVTPDEIRAGWAETEGELLAAFGRLVAADKAPEWRNLMLEQVPVVQSFGGAIPHWAGWVA